MICTFFGHRDTPQEVEPILYAVLIDLIQNKNVILFYVGNQGNFDRMVRKNLKMLKQEYPYIKYYVVLAYMPREKKTFDCEDGSDTIYPHGMENTPPRYAISKRNRWMIEQADYVVTYVKHSIGGAAQFKELAEKKGKIILDLTK